MPATKKLPFRLGSWANFCQRCGKKTYAENIVREWTGLLVCRACFELRQPQDFVQGVIDEQAPPWTTSEPVDTFAVAPPPGFNVSTQIIGRLTAPLATGPWEFFDNANTLSVSTNVPLLSYATTQSAILSGANMAAIYNNASAAWEIVQFQNVSAGTSGAWNLTGLLRGRVGTENTMANAAPAGSPFYYLGQSSASLYDWINNNLFAGLVGLANMHFSPVNISAAPYFDGLNLGVLFSWTRRSRGIRLDQPDIDPIIDSLPLGDIDERYSVDIFNGGAVVATLNVVGGPFAFFTQAQQIAALGSVQSTFTLSVYQVSRDYGRGWPGHATVTAAASVLENLDLSLALSSPDGALLLSPS